MALAGLALPATRGSGGYFASRKDVEVAWGDLLIAVMTPIGGRFMRRGWGSGVSTVLFDPSDQMAGQMVEQYIRDTATQNCPHIAINLINVSVDRKQISVKVMFSLAGQRTEKMLTLDRRSTIQYLSVRGR